MLVRRHRHVIETGLCDQIVLDRRAANMSRRRILKQYRITDDRSEHIE
jgi:hypothetical protein